MSTIPTTRADLVEGLERSFAALQATLDDAGPRSGSLPCVDDWTLKDLVAVRAWWSEAVCRWIRMARNGEVPPVPAEGYRWNETPALNAAIVAESRRRSLRSLRERLTEASASVRALIDELSDRELLEPGKLEFAGSHAAARLIAMNTTRQYTTARTHIRRALRQG